MSVFFINPSTNKATTAEIFVHDSNNMSANRIHFFILLLASSVIASLESSDDLAQELEKAVAENNASEIISIATRGGNVNGSTQSGDSLVHLAVRTGSTSSITALGSLKPDLEVLNATGFTPLDVEAFKNNSIQAIRDIISAGANIMKLLPGGNTFLHIAAAEGQNEALQTLLRAGLDPNKMNSHYITPLELVVRAGNVQGAEILLQRMVNTGTRTEMEEDLLNIALEPSNVDMCKVFIKYSPYLRFYFNNTLVHLIIRMRNATEMLNVLEGHKVPLNIRNIDGLAPLHIATDPSVVSKLLDLGADVNFTTDNGDTALHIASANNSLEVVKVLVKRGAGINIQDYDGVTALMFAANNTNSNILVTYLLHSGADLSLKSKRGRTALHYAAEGGCSECVLTLLDNGAKLENKDINGITSLHLAARGGHVGVVTLLLDRGAELTAKNDKGSTPLMMASLYGHLDVAKLLVGRGASLNDKDNSGMTALGRAHNEDIRNYLKSKGGIECVLTLLNKEESYAHTSISQAAGDGHIGRVKELLDCGADLTAKSFKGATPLMISSLRGHSDIVKLLVERGSPLNDKDEDGYTALHYAIVGGHVGVVKEELDLGADITRDMLGATGKTVHEITLKQDKVTYVKERRYPQALRHHIREELQSLKRQRIIIDSTSPYNSPLWAVKKKSALRV
ncbi:putative ankyrin repeat protein RF_0381 [Halyomorpha halys]|uniref:putative ankyrin repeat protein RF_0381 n=1 Tax=Halyomorpha halys TaxID=286706 RepID=UPI0034D1E9EC